MLANQNYELAVSNRQETVLQRALLTRTLVASGEFIEACQMIPIHASKASAKPSAAIEMLRLAQICAKPWIEEKTSFTLQAARHDGRRVHRFNTLEGYHLKAALDLLGRIHQGQLWVLQNHLVLSQTMPSEKRDLLAVVLGRAANYATGLSGQGFWDITNPNLDDEARVAWELEKVVHQQLSPAPSVGDYLENTAFVPEVNDNQGSTEIVGSDPSAAPN